MVGVIFCVLSGCKRRYKTTETVCKDNLFVETFIVYPLEENYLTDSSTFRVYIGKYDEDNESYSYKCNRDTIIVEKFSMNDNNPKDPYKRSNRVVDKQVLDLATLKKDHPFRQYN